MTLERITKARAQLVNLSPFFGVLGLGLEVEQSDKFETMATDGKKLLWNSAFVASINDAELRGVIAHEIYHCALGHFARQGARDNDQWNEACDYAINLDLLDMGFELPDGALVNPSYRGMSAEQIYSKLASKPKSKRPKSGCGEVMPGNGNANEQQALARDWTGKALQVASMAGKQAGSLPNGIARAMAEIKQSKVNWRELLRDLVSASNERDYSWNRPNRRFIGSGLYLPSLQTISRGEIAVAIDTSGSIDDSALQAFTSELSDMFASGVADRIHVIYCDTAIHNVQTFEQGDALKIEAIGRGGTRFSPVMQWMAEHGNDCACLIYFTDLGSNDFGAMPHCPVIWAHYGSYKPKIPFGDVVPVDGHD